MLTKPGRRINDTMSLVAGSGPVPARPQTGRTTKHHLVFEASRAVTGDTEARQRHTDTRLQAEVYNSPRFDKGELFLYIPSYSYELPFIISLYSNKQL